MFFHRAILAAWAVAPVLLLGGCAGNLAFRVVDAETREPLADLKVERTWVHAGLPLYIESQEKRTDASGVVKFEGVDTGENITFNPRERDRMAMGALSGVHWTNGRRDVRIVSYWPEVTYELPPHWGSEKPEAVKAKREGDVYVIPIRNEAKERVARVEAILAKPKLEQLDDSAVQQECWKLREVGGKDALPEARKVFARFAEMFAAQLATGPNDYSGLSRLTTIYGVRVGLGDRAAVEDLRKIYEQNKSRMVPAMEEQFRTRVEREEECAARPAATMRHDGGGA